MLVEQHSSIHQQLAGSICDFCLKSVVLDRITYTLSAISSRKMVPDPFLGMHGQHQSPVSTRLIYQASHHNNYLSPRSAYDAVLQEMSSSEKAQYDQVFLIPL